MFKTEANATSDRKLKLSNLKRRFLLQNRRISSLVQSKCALLPMCILKFKSTYSFVACLFFCRPLTIPAQFSTSSTPASLPHFPRSQRATFPGYYFFFHTIAGSGRWWRKSEVCRVLSPVHPRARHSSFSNAFFSSGNYNSVQYSVHNARRYCALFT